MLVQPRLQHDIGGIELTSAVTSVCGCGPARTERSVITEGRGRITLLSSKAVLYSRDRPKCICHNHPCVHHRHSFGRSCRIAGISLRRSSVQYMSLSSASDTRPSPEKIAWLMHITAARKTPAACAELVSRGRGEKLYVIYCPAIPHRKYVRGFWLFSAKR